jgi:hypothetical protein
MYAMLIIGNGMFDKTIEDFDWKAWLVFAEKISLDHVGRAFPLERLSARCLPEQGDHFILKDSTYNL